MISLSPEMLVLISLGAIALGVLIGFPLALPIGMAGLIIGYLIFDPCIGSNIFETVRDST